MDEMVFRSSAQGFFEVQVPGWEAFRITGRADVVQGQPRVTQLHLDPVEGSDDVEGLTASRLRALPLADIAASVVYGVEVTVDLEAGTVEWAPETEAALRRIAERPVAKHDSRAVATVEQVSEIWNRAYAAGVAPRGTVCTVLGITERTADRYIKRGREMGLIPTTKTTTTKKGS